MTSRHPFVRTLRALSLACCLAGGALLAASAAHAQTGVLAPPQNVLQLSASATVEATEDYLVLTLGTARDGTDAAAVQAQLRQALDAALAKAKPAARPEQLEVRTGTFRLNPRYGRDGKMTGWQGSAELVLEGRDFKRITDTAAQVDTLTISNVAFGLSREARTRSEADAQTQAIDAFKQKAGELARGFGFADYGLREVSVNASRSSPPMPRVMAMEASAAKFASEPLPVEAGKASVTVNVSGSVQLK